MMHVNETLAPGTVSLRGVQPAGSPHAPVMIDASPPRGPISFIRINRHPPGGPFEIQDWIAHLLGQHQPPSCRVAHPPNDANRNLVEDLLHPSGSLKRKWISIPPAC